MKDPLTMRGRAVNLDGLQTESRNPESQNIDQLSSIDLVRLINREDVTVAQAIVPCLEAIAQAINVLIEKVRLGGRVFYIGAGTSGRLGILDASEIPPTYSAPTEQFVALIAGGDGAMRRAIEGAEDSFDAAAVDLQAAGFNPEKDGLIGIAASGRTPYVIGGLLEAKRRGCTTIGIVCVQPSILESSGATDVLISPITGPEVVTGSTRMKAGTATKMVLNMISTGIMVKNGKTYGNLMIDLRATNLKLQQRARAILRQICASSCPESDNEIDNLLDACSGSVKLAAAAILLHKPVDEVRFSLDQQHGSLSSLLSASLDSNGNNNNPIIGNANGQTFVAVIDAGGTSIKATLMDQSGQSWTGQSGPCNILTLGIEVAEQRISEALSQAISVQTGRKDHFTSRRLKFESLSRVWVAMAGCDRPELKRRLETRLRSVLGVEKNAQLLVTTDVDLLAASAQANSSARSAIVLIAGTGSIAMSFKREESGCFHRTGRIGGWGPIMGDEGSGYWLGLMALRRTLAYADLRRLREVSKAMSSDVGVKNDALVEHVLTHLEDSHSKSAPWTNDFVGTAAGYSVEQVANIARIVLDDYLQSVEAKSIVEQGAKALAEMVRSLVNEQQLEVSQSVLVVSGGLMNNEVYRMLITTHLSELGVVFPSVCVEQYPALSAAEWLRCADSL